MPFIKNVLYLVKLVSGQELFKIITAKNAATVLNIKNTNLVIDNA
jgi:hypothetical protein